jgi:hypothetical protein
MRPCVLLRLLAAAALVGACLASAPAPDAAAAAAPAPGAARAVTAAGTKSHDGGGGDKVYLRSITALVFSENARARSRRGGRRPQLACVGGSAAGLFWGGDRYPRVAQCANVGWDGSSVQWRCEATLGDGLEFGDTTVLCEGYDAPGDEYIVRGSCRLEYTLNYSTFQVSAAHVVYGSFLSLALLWFYWQARFWLHARVAKFETALDRHVGAPRAAAALHPSYGAAPSTAADGYTGRPLE